MTDRRNERERTLLGGPWALLAQATALPRSAYLYRPLVAPGRHVDDGRRLTESVTKPNGKITLRALLGNMGRLAKRIVEKLDKRIRERSAIRTLSALDDRQLADIGVDRSNIRALAHGIAERATESKRTFTLKELRAEPVNVGAAANDTRRPDAA